MIFLPVFSWFMASGSLRAAKTKCNTPYSLFNDCQQVILHYFAHSLFNILFLILSVPQHPVPLSGIISLYICEKHVFFYHWLHLVVPSVFILK